MTRFIVAYLWGTWLLAQTFSGVALSSSVPSPADVWLMDEGAGNTLADSSGTANAVTASGSLSWGGGPGVLAGAAHFPGTFDSSSANHTNFNPTLATPFSVSTWVSFDSTAGLQMIVSQLSPGPGQGWYLFKNSAVTQQEYIAVFQNSSSASMVIGFYLGELANHPLHMVMTVDGSGTPGGVNLWVNGVMLQPLLISNSLGGASITPNANIMLGSWNAGTDRLAGYMAGVRIYNRALSQAEILSLYFAGPQSATVLTYARASGTVNAADFATLDADCTTGAKIGGGAATDNTAKLNAVLLTASSASPLDLILTGCTVTSGLFVLASGYTTIEGNGWNSGLYVLAGSEAAAIENGFGIYPTTLGSIPGRGSNVAIKNLKVNGNRTNNAVAGDPHGVPWIPGIDLSNVNGLTLDTVWVYDAPTYAFHGANNLNTTIRNSRMESPSHAINTDGLHFDGPNSGITISGGYLYTGDDAIALNAPEGYSGTISNVAITNPGINTGSENGLREYGTVHSVVVNGCRLSDTSNLSVGSSVLISAADLDALLCFTSHISGSVVRSGSLATQ